MLHDLGLLLNETWITKDRRFEVDSAFATTSFVESQLSSSHETSWDSNRLQLLFDSVLLSSEFKLSLYKQATVALVTQGVLVDLQGAQYGITDEEYNNVEAAFPRLEFVAAVNATFVQLCIQKPESTYGLWYRF